MERQTEQQKNTAAADEEKRRVRDRASSFEDMMMSTIMLLSELNKLSKNLSKFAAEFALIANLNIAPATRADMLQTYINDYDDMFDTLNSFRKAGAEREKRENEVLEAKRKEANDKEEDKKDTTE
jgi:hypothetical protein